MLDLNPLNIKETRKFMGSRHFIITGWVDGPKNKHVRYSVVCKDIDRAIELIKTDYKDRNLRIDNITLQGAIDRVDSLC